MDIKNYYDSGEMRVERVQGDHLDLIRVELRNEKFPQNNMVIYLSRERATEIGRAVDSPARRAE
jgi:hypothetical protein